jgi:16S rRNA (uracil1498-N3)-methyltransferase
VKDAPRLHLDQALEARADLALDENQARYLSAVMRLKPGDPVRVFNGRDGEWLAYVGEASKKRTSVVLENCVADAKPPPDIDFVFAPLKHARLDYMVQKAVELGARRLRPVITRRTIAERVNLDRMRANAVEAAEQCNLVFVPEVLEPAKFEKLLADWDPVRCLIHCDETAQGDPLSVLKSLSLPAAVLVGPEGGFASEERALIASSRFATAIALGPRILRADTAAAAALTLVQAVLGDTR